MGNAEEIVDQADTTSRHLARGTGLLISVTHCFPEANSGLACAILGLVNGVGPKYAHFSVENGPSLIPLRLYAPNAFGIGQSRNWMSEIGLVSVTCEERDWSVDIVRHSSVICGKAV